MNKSFKAILRGYVLFRCDGKYTLTYQRAKTLIPKSGTTSLDGWHIWTALSHLMKNAIRRRGCPRKTGWLCFYTRIEPVSGVGPTIAVEANTAAQWQNWTASADL